MRSLDRAVRGAALVTVTTMLMAVAGCGGSAPGRAGSAGSAAPAGSAGSAAPAGSAQPGASWDVTQMPDPCRTITLSEVTTVISGQVSGGVRLDSWPPLCAFTISGPPQEYLYVSDDSRETAKDGFDRQRTDSSTPEQVDGIGDRAYWLPEYTALHVLSGPTHLTVNFAGPKPPADAKTKALALARTALPRAKPSP